MLIKGGTKRLERILKDSHLQGAFFEYDHESKSRSPHPPNRPYCSNSILNQPKGTSRRVHNPLDLMQMKLADALNSVRQIPADAERIGVYVACGFTPLHLGTLLAAELWQALRKRPEIQTGLYGNLHETLRRGIEGSADFVACALEWPDLDPRLGLRSLGGWSPTLIPDIIETANRRMLELEGAIEEVSLYAPVALSLPTLPLPPISFTARHQAGRIDLELHASIAAAAVRLGQAPNVRILNLGELDRLSPPEARLDVKSELSTGFPYSLTHAAAVAGMLARLISDPPPKKGLITDLDNTLWKGIVGEVGTSGISWTLDGGGQIHGLYQQLLASLADAGVLLAVATKNDRKVVEAALARRDLILTSDQLFPIEAGWEPKSRSVARILRAWNISADSVVFVDDSAFELAEVAESNPGIGCYQFLSSDPQAAYRLMEQLRDSFGKGKLLNEDRLRAETIRRSAMMMTSEKSPGGEDFVSRTKPQFTAEYSDAAVDARALELINKTNQFNLNGKRHTSTSLARHLQKPGAFILVVSYTDKYGPLGKIAVLCGVCRDGVVRIETWVMSCRAFSRRIEYWCVEELFRHFAVDTITLDFQATERNRPLQEFLAQVLGGPPVDGCKIKKGEFLVGHSASN